MHRGRTLINDESTKVRAEIDAIDCYLHDSITRLHLTPPHIEKMSVYTYECGHMTGRTAGTSRICQGRGDHDECSASL